MKSFQSEKALVRAASAALAELRREFGPALKIRHEVPTPGGITDLVIFLRDQDRVNYVITVEFKLRNWRRALQQAFKNRNFGNEAYVVLDAAVIESTLKHLSEFKRANVGLASLDRNNAFRIWHYPDPCLPFSGQFSERVAGALLKKRTATRDSLRFIRSVKGGASLASMRNARSTV